jgi:23S rRNA-/tRNA-specific pseudouridylate synthase
MFVFCTGENLSFFVTFQVHRLDKETSGAMVIGRTHQSTVFLHALLRIKSSEMTQLWKGHGQNIERRYWALVVGTPTKLQGRISSPLAKVLISVYCQSKTCILQDSF